MIYGRNKNETIQKLNYIHKVSRGKIPSKPRIIAVNDNIVVGLITETNQFVPVNPEPYISSPADDDLKIIQYNTVDKNMLDIDKLNLTVKNVDMERIIKVKKIKLESYFFNAFRNLIRITFANPEHLTKKQQILEIINKVTVTYIDKLRRVNEILTSIYYKYMLNLHI